ncbi:MAG: hypothetical protein GY853_00670 [PVC group bacterium]|nr:hypothetical protein [PVC group bacterium]
MDNEEEERDLTEREMMEHLSKIADSEGIFENPSTVIRFLAKMLFNYRADFEFLIIQLKDLMVGLMEMESNKNPENKKDFGGMFS